jgi:hypothetical protein
MQKKFHDFRLFLLAIHYMTIVKKTEKIIENIRMDVQADHL